MQNRIGRWLLALILTLVPMNGIIVRAVYAEGSSEGAGRKEDTAQQVTLADLPAPARNAAEKATVGGTIEKIDREVEKGKVVYDVEATVKGKHVEYTIAADGTIVGTETTIDYRELPDAVRAAAERFFGSSAGLKATKGAEEGKTTYEVQGLKCEKVSAEFEASGKFIKEEK